MINIKQRVYITHVEAHRRKPCIECTWISYNILIHSLTLMIVWYLLWRYIMGYPQVIISEPEEMSIIYVVIRVHNNYLLHTFRNTYNRLVMKMSHEVLLVNNKSRDGQNFDEFRRNYHTFSLRLAFIRQVCRVYIHICRQ